MCNYERTCKDICNCNLVCNYLICLLPLQSSVSLVHLSNAFWYRKKFFPKVSSQNEIVPLLTIFHLPCSCCYQNQNFSLVSHSCCSCSTRVALVLHSCSTRVALVSHSCCSCLTCVALTSNSCRLRCTRIAPVWQLCCKIDQITRLRTTYKKNLIISERKLWIWGQVK